MRRGCSEKNEGKKTTRSVGNGEGGSGGGRGKLEVVKGEGTLWELGKERDGAGGK